MRVGFTGTRYGMTEGQERALADWLMQLEQSRPIGITEFHHGDCVGADYQAHRIVAIWARLADYNAAEIHFHIHPPTEAKFRAFARAIGRSSQEHLPLPYLVRNRAIVDGCDVLLVAPAESTEQRRGGTWYTARYARKQGKPIAIFWPDGKVTSEGELK